MRSASAAVRRSPVSKNSLARAAPTSQGQMTAPPVASDDAYPHVWVTNSGVVSRENDIGKQRHGRPKACGWTVHRCDHGLLDFQQVNNDLARLSEQGIERRRRHVLKPLDIPASAKRPALAGE